MQVISAFGSVEDSFVLIVASYTEIAEYQSVVGRLAGFGNQVDGIAAERHGEQPIAIERGGHGVDVAGLDLRLPGGELLREDIALAARPGNPGVGTGPPGAAKRPLLRAS